MQLEATDGIDPAQTSRKWRAFGAGGANFRTSIAFAHRFSRNAEPSSICAMLPRSTGRRPQLGEP